MVPILFAALVLLLPQERIEDHSWLRLKPGAWIKNKVTTTTPTQTLENVQTLTLKEIDGDEYVIEESYAAPGSTSSSSRRKRGIKDGTEALTVAGKKYNCTIYLVKGTKRGEPTESRFWIPEGSRNAVKIVFKEKGSEGVLVATSVNEQVTALGKTLSCNLLKGDVKFGDLGGTLSLLLCEDIPGSQVRATLTLKGPDVEWKMSFEAVEVHEPK
jgi:hypothetical protein